jgi:hypothetical protein
VLGLLRQRTCIYVTSDRQSCLPSSWRALRAESRNTILILKLISKRILGALIAVIGVIIASHVLNIIVATLTAAVVVIVGVEQGIILAMILSIIDHLRRRYRPKNLLLTQPDSADCEPSR